MRSRKTIPRIVTRTGADGQPDDRLLILENESEAVGGRPVGPQVRQPSCERCAAGSSLAVADGDVFFRMSSSSTVRSHLDPVEGST